MGNEIMGNRLVMCFLLLSSLRAVGTSEASAQQSEASAFLRSLSFEWYGGRVVNGYEGFSTSGRLGIAIGKAPMLNRIFTHSPEASGDLVFLAGVKGGTINAPEQLLNSEVQLLAPELSIHYPLMKISRLLVYGGPSFELMYTNNSRQYIAVPALGADIGLVYNLMRGFGLAVESRWILTSSKEAIVNKADFPLTQYAYINIGVHFSLPWQSEESVFSDAQVEYEKMNTLCDETRWELKKRIHEIDSLNSENSELKKDMASMTVRVRVDTIKVLEDLDRYDPAKKTESPDYVFTKDPFKWGSLMNDGYLKNVLIDILDEEYVWQVSTRGARKSDAERIRNFFVAYNRALGRRIAISLDESVSTFKLTCLGKVKGMAAEIKKN